MTQDIENNEDQKSFLEQVVASVNVLDMIDEDQKVRIAEAVDRRYEDDRETMRDWLKGAEKATRMAMQLKSDRGERSNIQYPMVAQAAIAFNARALPTFIKGERIAQPAFFGDRDGSAMSSAKKIAEHMSYTALHGINGWQEEFDRLTIMLPTTGQVYKKTWWNPVLAEIEDKLVLGHNLTLDNINTTTLETTVTTERYCLTNNEILERENLGLFEVGSLDKLLGKERDKKADEFKVHEIREQHTWLDLDGDGVFEPYIVYQFHETKDIIGIEPRFGSDDVVVDKDTQEIIRINANCHYTAYGFIPSFDGTFLHIGFGHLIGPLNSAINTLYNQILDAGTNANMNSGFISTLLNLGEGPIRIPQNAWLPVNAGSQALANSIFPLPVREPSAVLFQLLGMTVELAKSMSSTSDIMTGTSDTKNVPATTILAMIEQGMVVMTAIYKRMYRAMTKEMAIWMKFYKENMPEDGRFRYGQGGWVTVRPEDYKDSAIKIIPIADPNMSSQLAAIAKAKALLEIMPMNPNIDAQLVLRYYIEALAIDNLDATKVLPDGGLPPVAMEAKRANDIEEAKLKEQQFDRRIRAMEIASKVRVDHANVIKMIAEAESKEAGTNLDTYRAYAMKIQDDLKALDELAEPDDTEQQGQAPAGAMGGNEEEEAVDAGSEADEQGAGMVAGMGEPPDDGEGDEAVTGRGAGSEPGDVSDLRGPSGRARPPSKRGQ